MSKNNGKGKIEVVDECADEYVQNTPPIFIYSSFEEFWYSCIKGQDYFLMNSAKEHLRALGWYDNQSKWLEGVKHFGIPIEKSKK
jgi:hypothetical protein